MMFKWNRSDLRTYKTFLDIFDRTGIKINLETNSKNIFYSNKSFKCKIYEKHIKLVYLVFLSWTI